jgi:hypothetical protein
MMAANYQHIGGRENRLGRHYSRFLAFWPAAPLAAQSLARRKSRNSGSNRRSWARLTGSDRYSSVARTRANGDLYTPALRDRWETTYFPGIRAAGLPEE